SRLALSGNANRVLAAEAMASSGADVALHPSVAPGSPNLRRQMGDRESYEVRVTGEGGRLNLNWLTTGEDPTRLGILRRYLGLKGIDLNDLVWASRDVLRALPGMRDDLVDRFLQLRRGPDGIDGTADDAPFNNLTDVQIALGLTAEQFQQIAGLVGFKDQVFRIMSVGKS